MALSINLLVLIVTMLNIILLTAQGPPASADLPIALRKGRCATLNPHPIYDFLSYHHLSPTYNDFVCYFLYPRSYDGSGSNIPFRTVTDN